MQAEGHAAGGQQKITPFFLCAASLGTRAQTHTLFLPCPPAAGYATPHHLHRRWCPSGSAHRQLAAVQLHRGGCAAHSSSPRLSDAGGGEGGAVQEPCRPVMLQAAEAGQQPQQTGSSGAAQQAGAPHAPLPTLPGAALNPAHYSFAFGLASAGRRSRICSKRQRRCQAIFNRWLSCWRGQSWNSHPVVPGWPWAAAAAPDDQACSERRHHRYRLLAARKASAWPLRSWPDQAAMFP